MKYRALMIAAAALCLSACQENHSALTAHGPVAGQIANLTWFLLAVVAAVAAIVAVTLWLALRGSNQSRKWIADPRAVIAGGVIFPVIVLSILLGYGLHVASGLSVVEVRSPVRIDVTGEQWWWRVRYRSGDRTVETANEVRIPVGQDIVFNLSSADVIHSFWIPSLAGKMDMIPGRTTTLRLAADRPGIYRGICAEYCGGAHAFMALDVIAMPKADYEAWLSNASVARTPSTESSRRGADLFARSGCGGCHAIGGTAANGTIGPDLTTLASRRWIAAGLLPMNEDSLARFIAEGQHLKPGNKMPPFRIFSGDELRALTSFLAELK
jgi:cytochrome c oxidase subunit II